MIETVTTIMFISGAAFVLLLLVCASIMIAAAIKKPEKFKGQNYLKFRS
jgi:hypothetical protein